MTNNIMPRIEVKVGISAKIIVPNCPKSLMLDGGGQVSTKALDEATLNKIADIWRDEFIKKAAHN